MNNLGRWTDHGRRGIALCSYFDQQKHWPTDGNHIIGNFDEHSITVYQAFMPEIGLYAAEHKRFEGCGAYGKERMTWIKTNFLWMMYRSGWGTKKNQEVTLAIKLRRGFFCELLERAVPAVCYDPEQEKLRTAMDMDRNNIVRLQWDPDHDPKGLKHPTRRAIQLGLKGYFKDKVTSGEEILDIVDISSFVAEQRALMDLHMPTVDTPFPSELLMPCERLFLPPISLKVYERIGLSQWDGHVISGTTPLQPESPLGLADDMKNNGEGDAVGVLGAAAPPPPAPPPPRPARILCLHGHRGDAEGFRRKTAALRKKLGKGGWAELVYLEAPLPVRDPPPPPQLPLPPQKARPPLPGPPAAAPSLAPSTAVGSVAGAGEGSGGELGSPGGGGGGGAEGEGRPGDGRGAEEGKGEGPARDRYGRTWWYIENREYVDKTTRVFELPGLDVPGLGTSLEHLRRAWADLGPFDGLLGFSQGACAASLLHFAHTLAVAGGGESCPPLLGHPLTPEPKFLILVSGFASPSPNILQGLYPPALPLRIKTLHIYSLEDPCVPAQNSKGLSQIYELPKVIEHRGGHSIPQNKATIECIKQFIGNSMDNHA